MSIKDKITEGTWIVNEKNPWEVTTTEKNIQVANCSMKHDTPFVAAIPKMLSIMEDLAWYYDTCRKPSRFIKRIGTNAKELLKQLQNE